MTGKNDQYSPEEAAWRRDEVIRRMANTPPQPRVKSHTRRSKKKKPAASGGVVRKSANRDKES